VYVCVPSLAIPGLLLPELCIRTLKNLRMPLLWNDSRLAASEQMVLSLPRDNIKVEIPVYLRAQRTAAYLFLKVSVRKRGSDPLVLKCR